MKIKSDSLYNRMGKELRDEFFGWYLSENPSYEEMLGWFDQRGLPASNGAVWTLTNKHIATWKIDQAVSAGDEEADALPSDVDAKTRERVKALKFDLVMSDLSAQQKLSLLANEVMEDSNAIKREANATKKEALELMRKKFEAAEARITATRDALKKLNQSGGLTPEARAEIEKAMGLL